MAEAFTDDKDLQILNLAGNKINNPGAKALGRCIEKNMTLAELCLDSNMIGHEGWEALNLGMNRNKDGAISFVSLAGNTGGLMLCCCYSAGCRRRFRPLPLPPTLRSANQTHSTNTTKQSGD